MGQTAIVIGATGLVGTALIKTLIEEDNFSEIKLLHRRETGFTNAKIKEYIINFGKPDSYNSYLGGDVLFSTLGSTLKKSGSKEAQYKIDYHYQFNIAKAALDSGVKKYVLVSSVGADPNSKNFYSRMKGELEESVKKLKFQQIIIMQPSILDGLRKEFRLLERIGITITRFMSWIPGIRKYRPIHANIVSKAMINSLKNSDEGIFTYKLEEIFDLAEKK